MAAVRARFPALASGAAYLDGPGGSQVPQEVLDAVDAYLRESNANLGGAFATSAASDEVMARGRAAAADFTGGDPEGIAFGANMTTLNFLLAHAVARTLEPGDEIVVTAARPRRQRLALAARGRRPRAGRAPRADPDRRRDARPRRAGGS